MSTPMETSSKNHEFSEDVKLLIKVFPSQDALNMALYKIASKTITLSQIKEFHAYNPEDCIRTKDDFAQAFDGHFSKSHSVIISHVFAKMHKYEEIRDLSKKYMGEIVRLGLVDKVISLIVDNTTITQVNYLMGNLLKGEEDLIQYYNYDIINYCSDCYLDSYCQLAMYLKGEIDLRKYTPKLFHKEYGYSTMIAVNSLIKGIISKEAFFNFINSIQAIESAKTEFYNRT